MTIVDVARLPAPPVPGESRPWRPVDLADVLDGRYVPPKPTVGGRQDGVGMFYPGRVHSVYGESEGGKTWLALEQARLELAAGNGVLFLDFEDDEGGVVGRLLALGARRDHVRDRFAYLRPDAPVTLDDNRSDLAAALGDLRPTLALLDGVTEAMSMHGLSLKDNDDVAAFGVLLPRWIAGRGPAAVALDHVTKDRETRGRYAIGGAHKLNGLNGAAYLVENRAPHVVGQTGRSTIYVAKDRPGQVRRESLPARESLQWYGDLVVTSHDEDRVDVDVVAPEERPDGFRPTVLMGRVADALTRATDPLTTRGVLDRVTGKQDAVRAALACLVDEGYVVIDNGPRGAHLHRLIRDFDEEK